MQIDDGSSGEANLFTSLFVLVITFLFLSTTIVSSVNDSLMSDGSLLTGTRYTINIDALETISEDNSVTVIGTGSSQMFKALDGICISNALHNDAYVYNIAQPSSRPYTDMLHIPRIIDSNPEIVLIEIAPNLLLNTSKTSEEYVELRFKLDTMNQDSSDLGEWQDIIDSNHLDWLALTDIERMKFKQEYFLKALEERLTRFLLQESNARDVEAYGWIPNPSSNLWFEYLQTPTFPADRYGFDGKSTEQRDEYNQTQMMKTGNYNPSYYNSQSHRALDYQIETLLENEIQVIIVSPPHHPTALSYVTENKWDGLNHTLDKYRNWPGVTVFDQTWSEGWNDSHFYDRNHLDDEGRLEFCNRLTPVIDEVLNQSEIKINFDNFNLDSHLFAQDYAPINTNQSPKLMVITVNVEAGSRCANLESAGSDGEHVSRCIWGTFGDERAGISEMMDAADEGGVKLSFFVDVLGFYSYGIDIIEVIQYIDDRGHDVQMRMYPSMVNATSWEEILGSDQWISSGAIKENYMSCWTQETSDYWFEKAMEIFDQAEVKRPIAFRAGAYRYCDTIITSMVKYNMTQSYNYNLFTTNQNFTYGYAKNFQWENGIYEIPVGYIPDENKELSIYSRMDESSYEQGWDIISTMERFFDHDSSIKVLTMSMYSFSFLSKNESGYFYLEDATKLEQFESFIINFPEGYSIVSASELQIYIDDSIIESEFILPLEYIQNECSR